MTLFRLLDYADIPETESVGIAFAVTLQVRGTDYKTSDGTCIRDYIDVTDLVDAHVKALEKAQPAKVGIYNVGTGKGSSVKEFVEACKKATGVNIKVEFLPRRP
ncbi:UDP-arabinose 4-epimerase 1-like, partial [Trifolium medium]|nr:UDP-arabinose 4-epimerase 1-like [Trifolium medium]